MGRTDQDLLRWPSCGATERSLPSALDAEVAEFIHAFTGMSPERRVHLVSKVAGSQFDALIIYGHHMASLAVRSGDTGLLVSGLIALALGRYPDPRNALPSIALHYHSAKKLGVEPDRIFDEACRYLDEDSQSFLRSFSSRSDEDKDVRKMGYEEGEDSDGFRYQVIPPPWKKRT